MTAPRGRRLRALAGGVLVGTLLLVGAVACGEDERPGTKIEWHTGTPGPGAGAAPPGGVSPAAG